MNGGTFNLILQRLAVGLIRLTPDLALKDKNEMADALLTLPRRGASLKGLFIDPSEISSLKPAQGCAVVTICDGARLKKAALFCEKDGYLLLFHPILSMLGVGKTDGRFKKLISIYGKNIYEIIKSAESDTESVSARAVMASENTFYADLAIFDDRTLKNALHSLLYKIAELPLKKELMIYCDNLCLSSSDIVSLTHTQYLLSELISVREQFGAKNKAELYVLQRGQALVLSLYDEAQMPKSKNLVYYLKIFSELAALLDAHCDVNISGSGELSVRVYIPLLAAL